MAHMTMPQSSEGRYRTRHSAAPAPSGLPVDNLLWRTAKVPLTADETRVQLELLPIEDAPEARPLPDPMRLMRERIDRAVEGSMASLRPMLNRTVREIEAHLDQHLIGTPDANDLVDAMLDGMRTQLRGMVDEAIALKSWTNLTPAE